MEYFSAINKNEILPFAATWMDMEGDMLSEMTDKDRQMLYIRDFMWNLKKYHKLMNKTTEKVENTIKWLEYSISNSDMLKSAYESRGGNN